MGFLRGQRYSAADIHETVGGQPQYYISTVNGVVVAAKLRRRLNPDAPHILLVGDGPKIMKNAELAARQAEPFPVFVADDDEPGFDFVGRFRGAGRTTDPPTLRHFGRRSGRPAITAVCFLEGVDEHT